MPIQSPPDPEYPRARLLATVKYLPIILQQAASALELDAEKIDDLGTSNQVKAKRLGIMSSEDLFAKLLEFNSSEEWQRSELRELFHGHSDVRRRLDTIVIELQMLRSYLKSSGSGDIRGLFSGAPSTSASSSPISGGAPSYHAGSPVGSGGGGGGCFVATAVYGSPLADDVHTLRKFRDEYLLRYTIGRRFVRFYYKYSPRVAKKIEMHGSLGRIARITLTPIVAFARWSMRGLSSKR